MISILVVVINVLPIVAKEPPIFFPEKAYAFLQHQESIPLSVKQTLHDPWFGKDKFLHFSVSAAMPGFLHYIAFDRFDHDEHTSAIGAVSVTALLGIMKECYDKRQKKHFSWRDLVWDGVGLTVGYFVFIHNYQ